MKSAAPVACPSKKCMLSSVIEVCEMLFVEIEMCDVLTCVREVCDMHA